MPTTTYAADAEVAANTEVSLADVMDEPFDLRGDNDPLVTTKHSVGGEATVNAITSVGQGAADGPGAGEVVVTGPYSVAFGDTVAAGDLVVVGYEAASGNEQV